MSFGIYAVGYLILIVGSRISGAPDAYSAAIHRGRGDYSGWDWGCDWGADHQAAGSELAVEIRLC